jgi:predicted GNAT family acetyltransferase
MSAPAAVVDNQQRSRFELTVDGHLAFAAYELLGGQIVLTHTETPSALRGRGVGSALARGALASARQRGLSVVPLCPFMAEYIRTHPDQLDLVSAHNRQRLRLET